MSHFPSPPPFLAPIYNTNTHSVIYFAHFSEICLHLKQNRGQCGPEKKPAAILAQSLLPWGLKHQNDLKPMFL